MAPEQIRREGIVPQSDLFALYVVVYELLTGRHPFRGDNLDAIEHQILNAQPEPIAAVRPDVSEIYQRIIDQALAKDQKQRYKSGLDMAGDIALVYEFLKQPALRLRQQEKYRHIENLHFSKTSLM